MTELRASGLDEKDLLFLPRWGQEVEERSLLSFGSEVSSLPRGKALWERVEHL